MNQKNKKLYGRLLRAEQVNKEQGKEIKSLIDEFQEWIERKGREKKPLY